MNCSLPGSSVQGIFQSRIVEWVAVSFSRASSQPKDRTWFSRIAGRLFTIWGTRELSTCNTEDPCLIPVSRRSAGEGIGYPLQYSWASLVAQLVKNLPAMWETWVWSLGWEDPLEKGTATHSNILAWRIPWTVKSMVSQRVGHNWVTFTFTSFSAACQGRKKTGLVNPEPVAVKLQMPS